MGIDEIWEPCPPKWYTNNTYSANDILTFNENVCDRLINTDKTKVDEFKHWLILETAMVEFHFDEQNYPLNYEKRKLLLDGFKKHCCRNNEWHDQPLLLNAFDNDEDFNSNQFEVEHLIQVHLKVKNYYLAQVFATDVKNDSLTIDMIQEIHRLLTDGEETNRPGEFRVGSVSTDWDDTIHPDHTDVEPSLLKLIQCVNEEIKRDVQIRTPYAIAAYFLYRFYVIHPFNDGNGRVARIVASAILCWCRLPFLISIWFTKNPDDNCNVFQVEKKERKTHNKLVGILNSNHEQYHGRYLAYMFLRSHNENLKRFDSNFPVDTQGQQTH